MSSDSSRYINPVSDAYEVKSEAKRSSSLSDATVGLVDSMLNPGAMWGQGILDAAEEFLSRTQTSLTFARVARTPVGGPSPARWATAMAEQYSALVTAAGD
ncbi:MAG: hypothetical protein OXG37_03060 [Actinomycetia bacterium]|nr:hypothetical protein [Actinomycetes bacterium]